MADLSLAAAVAEIKENPGKFYVYVMYRPCGTPFYVGMAQVRQRSEQRIVTHEYEAARKRLLHHRHFIIRKTWSDGLQVGYRIDSWHPTKIAAWSREIELISAFGRDDLQLGPLSNKTAGGDGAPELGPDARLAQSRAISEGGKRRFSNADERIAQSKRITKLFSDPMIVAAHVERMREVASRPEMLEKFKARLLKFNADQDAKDRRTVKIRAAHIARRNLTSERTKLQFSDPEQRAGASQRLKDRWKDPHAVKRWRDAMRAKYADPAYREMLSQNKKAWISRPGVKERLSLALRSAWKDTSRREKQAERVRASWVIRTSLIERCRKMASELNLHPVFPTTHAPMSEWLALENELVSS